VRRNCGCDDVICGQQHAFIVRQPWQQPVRPRARIDTVLASQRYRVALQLLDTEQFRTQQLSILIVTQRVMCTRRNPELFDDYEPLLA